MMQVRIATQPARLAMHTQPASLELRSQSAQLNITSTAATAEISQPQGTLTVDNYPCRAAIGLKNSADFTSECAELGQEAAAAAVDAYVQAGNRLAQISSPASSVLQLVTDRSDSRLQAPSITWAYVPLPDISYEPAPVQIDWAPAQLRYQVQPALVDGTYTPGTVDISVAQYASVQIDTADSGTTMEWTA